MYAKSAHDIGPPGCPLFAFLIASRTKPLITETENLSFSSFDQFEKDSKSVYFFIHHHLFLWLKLICQLIEFSNGLNWIFGFKDF